MYTVFEWWRERKHGNHMQLTTATYFAIRHTMTNSSSNNNNSSVATHRPATEIHGRCTQTNTRTSYSNLQLSSIDLTIRSKNTLVVRAHTRCLNENIWKKKKKKRYEQNKESTPGFELAIWFLKYCNLPLSTRFYAWCLSDWYISVRTNTHVGNFDEKTKTARAGSPPVESGERSKVRHVEQTPHRMACLISS